MKLRTWRLKEGMTQAQVADALGVHVISVCRWETDDRKPARNCQVRIHLLTCGKVTPNDWLADQRV